MTSELEGAQKALGRVAFVLNQEMPDAGPSVSSETKDTIRDANKAIEELGDRKAFNEFVDTLENTNQTLSDVFYDWGIADRTIEEGYNHIDEDEVEVQAEKLKQRTEFSDDLGLVEKTADGVDSDQFRDGVAVLFYHANQTIETGSEKAPISKPTQRLALMTAVFLLVVLLFGWFSGPAGVLAAQQAGGRETRLQEAWAQWEDWAEHQRDDRDI